MSSLKGISSQAFGKEFVSKFCVTFRTIKKISNHVSKIACVWRQWDLWVCSYISQHIAAWLNIHRKYIRNGYWMEEIKILISIHSSVRPSIFQTLSYRRKHSEQDVRHRSSVSKYVCSSPSWCITIVHMSQNWAEHLRILFHISIFSLVFQHL